MGRRHQLTELQVDLAAIFFTLDAAEAAELRQRLRCPRLATPVAAKLAATV